MELIQNNPYRIAGILSNATAKELQKQKGKIKAFSKVGKEIISEFDFIFLNSIERTEQSIEKAFSNIEQNQDKVNNSLFWFLKSSPFDETAISYLIKGDDEKAKEIWGKVTNGKDVNSKNFSAFNNIGTLKLLSKSEFEIKEGIEAKIKLIESEYFENFVHTVADQTFTIDNKKQSQKLIDELLTQFKKKYSSADALDLFSNCNGSTQKYLSQKFTEEPMHNIESNIESAKRKRKENKSDSYSFGLKLFVDTKDDLSLLKSLLGISDLNYKRVADELAKEIMQCGIDSFNENQDLDSDIDFLENSMKLAKLAETLAVGKFTKDKAKDNINSLKEMKDRELSQAIEALKSIKVAFETNEAKIREEVRSMNLGYNQTVNWTKVEQMIKNSLDWDKVVELVTRVIPQSNVNKIQTSDKFYKINQYKDLVDFLFSKLGPIQINQVKHICYWKDVRAAQAKSTARKVGSTIGKATDGGCYIATMAYGDYEHPQVIELRKFRDNILQNSIVGRSFIKFYYKYSPKLVELLKNQKAVNKTIRTILDTFIKRLANNEK